MAAASSATSISVAGKQRPPRRTEGGGFIIADIMSGLPATKTDPFLIWHELPRHSYRRGEMPGAPMHPHRGFNEVPYAKLLSGPTEYNMMNVKDHEGREVKMQTGAVEWGKVAIGLEHEALIDNRWHGEMHFFQLWVNLPRAHKFDAPSFQRAAPNVLPVVSVAKDGKARAKILVGKLEDKRSPVQSELTPVQYIDFMAEIGAEINHTPPLECTTMYMYVYAGQGDVQGTVVTQGEFIILSGTGTLTVKCTVARADRGGDDYDLGFLFIAGRPIGEPIVQHGPFVMTSREEIVQCFDDYQRGRLCQKPLSYKEY